jgi:hypothetical protein
MTLNTHRDGCLQQEAVVEKLLDDIKSKDDRLKMMIQESASLENDLRELELLSTCKDTDLDLTKKELKNKTLLCVRLETDLQCKVEQIKVMEDNLSYFLDETTQLKNKLKLCDNDQIEANKLQSIQNELVELKKYVYSEIKELKTNPSEGQKMNEKQELELPKQLNQKQQQEKQAQQQECQSEVENCNRGNQEIRKLEEDLEMEKQRQFIKEKQEIDKETGTMLTMILSDSMVGNIRNWELATELRHERASVQKFPGHTAVNMAGYAKTLIPELKPDKLIILTGTNDLSYSIKEGTFQPQDIAEKIMNVARIGRNYGLPVVVSSLFIRKQKEIDKCTRETNEILKTLCEREGFEYMNQSNIYRKHL